MKNKAEPTLSTIRAGTQVLDVTCTSVSMDIAAIQKALKLMGYYTAETVEQYGQYDELTAAAVRSFQRINKLPVNGRTDKALLANLEDRFIPIYPGHSPAPAVVALRCGFDYLDMGDTGPAVTKTRSLLRNQGYQIPITGSYDDALRNIIYEHQMQNGLTPNGRTDQQTFLSIENTTLNTGWLVNGIVSLTPGLLARCGFSGVLLGFYVEELNNALNSFGIRTKAKVRHFLAQCMAETHSGTLLSESGYGKSISFETGFYGAGFFHMEEYDYAGFYDYMKTAYGLDDTRIKEVPGFAPQYVAGKYPDYAAGWYWCEKKQFNQSIDWRRTDSVICTLLTEGICGNQADAERRLSYYHKISAILL